MTPDALVAECTELLEPLTTASNATWWDANVDASDETRHRRTDAARALSDALAEPDAFAAVKAARDASALDPLTARQLAILDDAFTPNQVEPDLRHRIVELETEIDARFACHRATVEGQEMDENAIIAALKASTDPAYRRAVWEASKTVGAEVADDVRALVRLRNDAARSLGFRDHFAMTLATTEFDEVKLFHTLDEVDAITAEPFRALKRNLDEQLTERYAVAVDDLRPWHYDDPFFQEPQRGLGVDLDPYLRDLNVDELTVRTFDSMGLDVRPVVGRSDLLPRAGKVQHAFCIDVDRGGDVRVLSNNAPGERWSETMLHEFGHAIYFCGVGADLPWLVRDMHMCLTEGVAMRCGRLVHDPDWLAQIAGLPASTVAELAPRLEEARRAQILLFARWVLVMTHFERGLYANPDGPHNDRWWDLVERYQLVRRPDDRHAPDWAAKIHFSVAPVYYHNYLFGELVASQLTEWLGPLVGNPDAGRALVASLFAPGATKSWGGIIADATGAPLSPGVLAREIA
jgi:peptidyl-dipeptidase A